MVNAPIVSPKADHKSWKLHKEPDPDPILAWFAPAVAKRAAFAIADDTRTA
jgi:hypothetical protein